MPEKHTFKTRGVVIVPQDLSLPDWPARAKDAGLTTIALHPTPEKVTAFVESSSGRSFLKTCEQLGLQVEYELHAMGELLPRALFTGKPELFRMEDSGARTPDANLCVSSEEALDTVAANAVRIARALVPSTNRYFMWGDDGKPGCRCPGCREYSESEQALVVENRIVEALRAEVRPDAQLAHLAYLTTLDAPKRVKPAPGVFLEFAPIRRDRAVAITAPESQEHLRPLDENLGVFDAAEAQVLEYWLDASLFSDWKRPSKPIIWSQEVFQEDLRAYAVRGIRHITTFAVYVDADYLLRHGEPPLGEYGAGLAHVELG